ncbi:MAG: hypothetical protein M1829_000458 [Trizodia sp. TS-e1964]|nr:MAG: hypothetical protein M1829_000458 [Trizodia sp. TS-e1964]
MYFTCSTTALPALFLLSTFLATTTTHALVARHEHTDPIARSLEARSSDSASPNFQPITMEQAAADMAAKFGPDLYYKFTFKTSQLVTAPWTPGTPADAKADLRVLIQVGCYSSKHDRKPWPTMAKDKATSLVIFWDVEEGSGTWKPFIGYTANVDKFWAAKKIDTSYRLLGYSGDPVAAEEFILSVPLKPVFGEKPLQVTENWARRVLEKAASEMKFLRDIL